MSLNLLILKINTTFEDVRMMLKYFFDFPASSRFSKSVSSVLSISVVETVQDFLIWTSTVGHLQLHTYGSWEVFFLCSPDCPKEPRTSFPSYRFFYTIICSKICDFISHIPNTFRFLEKTKNDDMAKQKQKTCKRNKKQKKTWGSTNYVSQSCTT